MSTFDGLMSALDEQAEYELVVSTAKVESLDDGDDNFLAVVTVDGEAHGFLSSLSLVDALENAAAALSEEVEAVKLLRAAVEEVGLERAVELLERQR